MTVPGWPAVLERGVAVERHAGEGRSGDVALFAPSRRGALVAAIDGLGHGNAAADAAETAAEVLRTHVEESPHAVIEQCHAELRRTRGAVMTLAWFDVPEATMAWTGVGNVEARTSRASAAPAQRYDSPVILGGVVGYTLPHVRVGTVELEPGDTVVMATDGVAADYSASLDPGVPSQQLAERVLERHSKGTDDALVVVVRFAGDA